MPHPRSWTVALIALGLFLLPGFVASSAQAPENESKHGADEHPAAPDPNREHAIELYKQGKFVQAMPLFEKLVADHPADAGVRESFAYCILLHAGTLSDPELRKKARVRARNVALEAKALGDTSQLLQVILDTPEDGTEPTYSNRKDVDDIMKSAEADFFRGDRDKARQGYERALLLDPQNYDAALFIGDVYFKQHILGGAGEWFAQAIKIDPNRETAYRYWGDALVAMGKEDEARSKFIDAIVADPYNRRSSTGLTNWLERNKLTLNTVQLKDAAAVDRKDDQHINITLDSNSLGKNDPNGTAWMMYSMNRALWNGDKFKKEFPGEPKYRRTLKEEVDCLSVMISVLKESKDYKKKQKHLDPGLQGLIKIQEAGFLEPFVLFSRADNDIAKDYAPYRDAHRENVRRYLDDFLVPKAPPATAK